MNELCQSIDGVILDPTPLSFSSLEDGKTQKMLLRHRVIECGHLGLYCTAHFSCRLVDLTGNHLNVELWKWTPFSVEQCGTAETHRL